MFNSNENRYGFLQKSQISEFLRSQIIVKLRKWRSRYRVCRFRFGGL
ncbi:MULTISPECIES: hypothetical protein [Cyanophyceae]|nr:hypothetical protein [Trichocoleus sp. FACHB-40]MBD2005005.1 hypothetical protein [Trichocoleus sp. FACHB-40]